MPEQDTTRRGAIGLFLDNFQTQFDLHITKNLGSDVPMEEVGDAANQSLLYVEAVITLWMMIDPYRISRLGSETMRALLLTTGELCCSLLEETGRFLNTIEDHRGWLAGEREKQSASVKKDGGKLLDEIATILSKTFALRGDTATVKDDQAVMMIRDLLFTSRGKEGANNE